jgi:hypothetical protein
MQTQTKLLTPGQAANFLGLKNEDTLSVWRATKRYPQLRYVKVGRLIRYSLADLEKFLEVRTVGDAGHNAA